MTPSFKTLTARFAGTCRRCGQPIAVGDTIRYGGRGLTYHLAADCAAQTAPAVSQQLQAAPVAPAVDDRAIMTAALATGIRQTFADLLARPVRLSDPADEPLVGEAAPVVEVLDVPAAPVRRVTVNTLRLAPQKARRARPATRRAAFVAPAALPVLDEADAF
jgi:hypothetical protein